MLPGLPSERQVNSEFIRSKDRNSGLEKKQKKLIHSLSTVRRICGNSRCQCRRDPAKKHRAMFLTWKENQKTQPLYIPVANYKEAQVGNENYKKLKKQIKRANVTDRTASPVKNVMRPSSGGQSGRENVNRSCRPNRRIERAANRARPAVRDHFIHFDAE